MHDFICFLFTIIEMCLRFFKIKKNVFSDFIYNKNTKIHGKKLVMVHCIPSPDPEMKNHTYEGCPKLT